MDKKNSTTDKFSERDKALQEALDQINKHYGKGAIMRLGDDSARTEISAISTGSMSLDIATGIGESREAGLLKYTVPNHRARQP